MADNDDVQKSPHNLIPLEPSQIIPSKNNVPYKNKEVTCREYYTRAFKTNISNIRAKILSKIYEAIDMGHKGLLIEHIGISNEVENIVLSQIVERNDMRYDGAGGIAWDHWYKEELEKLK